jgi:pyridoxal phosphate enzyme (YggS family)
MDDSPAARLSAVRSTMAAACAAAGRAPGSVRLLAVSKGQDAAKLKALAALGQLVFGENYAQELAAKRAALADVPGVGFVFIGSLQSNKLAAIVRDADAVQSLGSERHARLLARHAREAGKTPYPVHLLVNAGGESTKDGLTPAAVEPLARLIAAELPELRVRGVMAIPPPLKPGSAAVPELYIRLRALADAVGDGDLSLGMSQDLELAIRAGSDCVRVGTALFGARA